MRKAMLIGLSGILLGGCGYKNDLKNLERTERELKETLEYVEIRRKDVLEIRKLYDRMPKEASDGKIVGSNLIKINGKDYSIFTYESKEGKSLVLNIINKGFHEKMYQDDGLDGVIEYDPNIMQVPRNEKGYRTSIPTREPEKFRGEYLETVRKINSALGIK